MGCAGDQLDVGRDSGVPEREYLARLEWLMGPRDTTTGPAVEKPDVEELRGDHLLELYKLYVDLMDRNTARRGTTNAFFLSVNTVLMALLGASASWGGSDLSPFWAFAVAAAGIVLCYCWYRLVRSHRDLNTGRFEIIHKLEAGLPAALFKDEWEVLGSGKDPRKYLPFTTIEQKVPWVFAGLYGLVFAWSVLATLIPSLRGVQ